MSPVFPTATGAFVAARPFAQTSREITLALMSDQPGRVAAVCFVSPVLFRKGYLYGDAFLLGFSAVLFAWDLWWLLRAAPRTVRNEQATNQEIE